MPAPGRQIEGVRPETPVQELAHAAISQRLEAVTTQFPLAAEGAIEEHERVHQLRVATRRAVAALSLFQGFCPPRCTRRLLKKLKQIRRAAGQARDLDVLMIQWSASSAEAHPELMQRFMEQRQAAQVEIVTLFQNLMPEHQLENITQAVTDRIRPRGKRANKWASQPLAKWAPKRLRNAIELFCQAVPESLDTPEQLHPLRIEGKRLRYTLELLAPGLPAETYDALYPLLEKLQDRLGKINDHRSAIDRLTSHSVNSTQLIEKEDVAMREAVEHFGPWFHEDLLPQLEAVQAAQKE